MHNEALKMLEGDRASEKMNYGVDHWTKELIKYGCHYSHLL